MEYIPRLIFWETTRACNLECPHCRASAQKARSPLDLTTDEAKRFIDSAASFSKPILVFSGGEPLLRDDIYELARHAADAGLKATLATNATLITEEVAKKLKENGMEMIAVSVYGATADSHDKFCGEEGAFGKTLKGIENIKKAGIGLQINTTITKANLNELEAMGDFALKCGAVAYHIFFLVPTGRGKSMEADEISPQEYEEAFNRLYDLHIDFPIRIKATCAPHYYRVLRQRAAKDKRKLSFETGGFSAMTKGCLAGQGVCFISHKGEVFGCGYLPIAAGDLRAQDFKTIWYESELFKILRDDSKLQGRCDICEFKKICGGCRARAYAATENYLGEEPYCIYIPKEEASKKSALLDELDRLILNRIQKDFPLAPRPFRKIADELKLSETEVFSRVQQLTETGIIRRIGANFDSRKLNYKSTLVAMRVPEGKLSEVTSLINEFKGVTHNYLRNDTFNLWFTLMAPSYDSLNEVLSQIKSKSGIKAALNLPVTKQFKIKVEFELGDNGGIDR